MFAIFFCVLVLISLGAGFAASWLFRKPSIATLSAGVVSLLVWVGFWVAVSVLGDRDVYGDEDYAQWFIVAFVVFPMPLLFLATALLSLWGAVTRRAVWPTRSAR